MRFYVFILLIQTFPGFCMTHSPDSVEMLLSNAKIQIEATQAVNDMYNFKFDEAEMQFRWIRQKYPDHPLPYFLLGLSQWWKIMPNVENESWDELFFQYMDQSIEKAAILYQNENNRIEASFFLAFCYGQKGRLYSERGRWGKAANAARLAIKYHQKSQGMHELSPELLFGDALYNYYSVWIRENYPLLRPIMIPFPKGDKELGIEQLRTVAGNAFYTRIEAQLFLMRILALDVHDMAAALRISEYLYDSYPDNPYFHRFYARMLYSNGRRTKMETECLKILDRIEANQVGYEANSGRYAAFFLGQLNDSKGNQAESKFYYEQVVQFGDQIEAQETGYYLYSLLNLARFAGNDQDFEVAEEYLKRIRSNSKRKDPVNKQAKAYQKKLKKEKKNSRKSISFLMT